MWNQVGAEAILLIRTYAFFNRNNYVLVLLVSALAGVVAFQLYVASSQMLREWSLSITVFSELNIMSFSPSVHYCTLCKSLDDFLPETTQLYGVTG